MNFWWKLGAFLAILALYTFGVWRVFEWHAANSELAVIVAQDKATDKAQADTNERVGRATDLLQGFDQKAAVQKEKVNAVKIPDCNLPAAVVSGLRSTAAEAARAADGTD